MRITKGLPIEEIRKIKIIENGEPLVDILEGEKLSLLRGHKYLDARLRQGAKNLLDIAANKLPPDYKLLVVTAYRPIWMQEELYKRRTKQLARKYPLKMLFQYSKWKNLVNRYTSPPGGSSHQCGGAVDVTMVDSTGSRLDMGTSLTDFGVKVHTENELITNEQRKNRKILYNAMVQAGFINYPLEWWHYSYGDRMWAAYGMKNECFYGPIT